MWTTQVVSSMPSMKMSSPRASTKAKAVRLLGGEVLSRWKPSGTCAGPELLVLQGDLTSCTADAIVNAANTHLAHGGGLAGAIVRKGGRSIQSESSKWIKEHGSLSVGDAVTTASGALPCQHVIHTVGPNVGHVPPTSEHSAQLRRAVWSALMEAERLKLTSVALPGISTGIFGYPRDLGAKEIVRESVRFCKEKGETTKLQEIAFMNIDDPTVKSFVEALAEEKKREGAAEHDELSDQLAGLKILDEKNK
jgi:O-acetyl-ADP-ribose deacetylase (regulator of RNase III)